jgi:hypothetical protein
VYKLAEEYHKYPFIYEVTVTRNNRSFAKCRELALLKIIEDIVKYAGTHVRPQTRGDGIYQKYYKCREPSCKWRSKIQVIGEVEEYDP